MGSYIKPAAAFKKLDAAKLLRQNVYIYGSTGYGKTELVIQYFKNEKYIYIPCRQNGCDLSLISKSSGHTSAVVIDNVNSIESSDIRNEIRKLCAINRCGSLLSGGAGCQAGFMTHLSPRICCL